MGIELNFLTLAGIQKQHFFITEIFIGVRLDSILIRRFQRFFVDKWAAENEDNTYYHSILEEDGTLIWNRVLRSRIKIWNSSKNAFLKHRSSMERVFGKLKTTCMAG